ncbi:acyltransferase family protein [Candidatus Latescibacterota bacterium]
MKENTDKLAQGRVVSIDVLRGFDMFWIIGGGAVFLRIFQLFDNPVSRTLAEQLEHAYWHGFHFQDLIFPLFLFIVGASIPFSLSKRLKCGDSRKKLYLHVIKRSLTLYILGLIYYGLLDFNFAELRYVGVLPRIAACYFFTSLIVINTGIKGQVVWAGVLLIFYWALMMLIPVPGFGAGVITPEGNLSAYIDIRFLPGRFNHFGAYQFGDTTGLFGIVSATVSTLLGVFAGHWLRSSYSQIRKVQGLTLAGVVSLLIGLIWNFAFPINKHIWTSSFVLFAGGWCFLLLALFFWIIDIRGCRKWAFPFIIIGMNPITIYFLQGMFDFGIIAGIFVHGFIDNLGDFKPVFWEMCVLTVKWLFLYFLYKQKIFIKV